MEINRRQIMAGAAALAVAPGVAAAAPHRVAKIVENNRDFPAYMRNCTFYYPRASWRGDLDVPPMHDAWLLSDGEVQTAPTEADRDGELDVAMIMREVTPGVAVVDEAAKLSPGPVFIVNCSLAYWG